MGVIKIYLNTEDFSFHLKSVISKRINLTPNKNATLAVAVFFGGGAFLVHGL